MKYPIENCRFSWFPSPGPELVPQSLLLATSYQLAHFSSMRGLRSLEAPPEPIIWCHSSQYITQGLEAWRRAQHHHTASCACCVCPCGTKSVQAAKSSGMSQVLVGEGESGILIEKRKGVITWSGPCKILQKQGIVPAAKTCFLPLCLPINASAYPSVTCFICRSGSASFFTTLFLLRMTRSLPAIASGRAR